ncbi:MAG: D-alanyl-D-alanine carboxypeptidase (penicillin-binding protein 5/6) [Parcubacteria group bacterium Gr01-1014_48]|nr:MAG: D-alanyl-D-alanine carboxypeptidase (penicillin-binding protein 5/6) [Parcubacteria group bacterium Greene0416_14]TSC74147.1 MAG: D-alanyl-D-alanine carboxypeptidase (penicillin-binding protein 5/6) [Parcubacteria group bacterium Gr01-1014_48]TSD01696.1 MAG: D-alanyl-D-alanine carboxypeptidase (penicillin-binding protein 5/6) [Parcubacteria group bacterium Greene1014_15]TSD08170.1 MAG: D-alanyl-D-alanine carboxypeptidase (penicillin-binding protein 5/6) [Parcubacteria group bacterium Gre
MNSDDTTNAFDETAQPPKPESEALIRELEKPAHTDADVEQAPAPTHAETEEILIEAPLVLPALDAHENEILPTTDSKNKRIDGRQIPTALAFLIVGILIGSMFPISKNEQAASVATSMTNMEIETKMEEPAGITTTHEPKAVTNTFENMELEARAAYVWDINTRQAFFKKNPDAKLPLASLAKIMTAVTISDQVPRGTVVTVDKRALGNEGDTGLLSGEQWRLRDLLEFTLLVSSNDGAAALASITNSDALTASSTQPFVETMNKKAQEIGLTQSYFSNPSGLDTSEHESGAYGSVRDMARLFEYALRNIPEALEATTYKDLKITSLSGFTHDAKNTNVLIDRIPGLIASKTGFTNLAGGNLVIAFEAGPGKPVIIAVLGSTFDGRFSDVEKLVWATLAELQK